MTSFDGAKGGHQLDLEVGPQKLTYGVPYFSCPLFSFWIPPSCKSVLHFQVMHFQRPP